MKKSAQHDLLVLAMIEGVAAANGDMMGMMANLAKKFPDTTHEQFDAAMDEASSLIEERGRKLKAESEALERLAPLFDGMPAGMTVGECARVKAERGDPLAIDYLKWEALNRVAA